MKKLLFILIAAMFALSLNAQNITKSYKLDGINGVKASSVFSINVTKGTSNIITLTGSEELIKYVKIFREGNTAVFSLETKRNYSFKNRDNDGIKVEIQIDNFTHVDLSGASVLTSPSTFVVNSFDCELSGAANLKSLNLEARELDIDISGAANAVFTKNIQSIEGELSGAAKLILKGVINNMDLEVSGASYLSAENIKSQAPASISLDVSGASNINLAGYADKAEFEGSGASKISVKNLNAKYASIELSGASSASITATETLKMEASAASKIVYYGNPKNVITSTQNIRKGDN